MKGLKRFAENFGLIMEAYGLFLLCSVTVVTMGASLPALFYTLMQIERGKLEGSVKENFFKSFKLTAREGILAFLVYVLAGSLLVLGIYYARLNNGEGYWSYLSIFCWGIMIPFAVSVSFLFGVEARFTNKLKGTILYSLAMPIKDKKRAVAVQLIIAVGVVACMKVPYLWIAYLAFLGPVSLYAIATLYGRVFMYYLPENMRTEHEKELLLKDSAYQKVLAQRKAEADRAEREAELAKQEEERKAKIADIEERRKALLERMEECKSAGGDMTALEKELSELKAERLALEPEEERSAPAASSNYTPGQVISRYNYPKGYTPARKHSMAEILSMTSNEAEEDEASEENAALENAAEENASENDALENAAEVNAIEENASEENATNEASKKETV